MLNFGLKHRHSSGWHKKFPRQKIERRDPMHLGMREHLRFKNEYREGRQGYLSRKEIDNFLEVNLGKNVDKVFSEFCKRAKHYNHDESLRDAFYGELNPERRWRSLYTVDSQKKIVKVKSSKQEKRITNLTAYKYNEEHYPQDPTPYLNETEIVYFGHFYIRDNYYSWKLAPIFICSKGWYDLILNIGTGKKYVKVAGMHRVMIPFLNTNAYGIPENGYSLQRVPTGKFEKLSDSIEIEIYKTICIPYYTYRPNNYYLFGEAKNYYMFLTNIEGNWSQY